MNNWQDIEPVKTPEELCIESETKSIINKVLRKLSEKNERVIRLRFGIGERESTLREVGDLFGVTRERIRQREGKSLSLLRCELKKNGIK